MVVAFGLASRFATKRPSRQTPTPCAHVIAHSGVTAMNPKATMRCACMRAPMACIGLKPASCLSVGRAPASCTRLCRCHCHHLHYCHHLPLPLSSLLLLPSTTVTADNATTFNVVLLSLYSLPPLQLPTVAITTNTNTRGSSPIYQVFRKKKEFSYLRSFWCQKVSSRTDGSRSQRSQIAETPTMIPFRVHRRDVPVLQGSCY